MLIALGLVHHLVEICNALAAHVKVGQILVVLRVRLILIVLVLILVVILVPLILVVLLRLLLTVCIVILDTLLEIFEGPVVNVCAVV